MDLLVEQEMWFGSLELVRLRGVLFRRIRLLWRTLSLLELLVVRPMVLGCGGAPRSRGYIPLLLGRPMNELELCRRDASGYTRGCIRGDVVVDPDAGMIMSISYDS